MKALYTSTLLTLALGLGACTSEYPLVEGYPLTYQKKFWVVQHWDGIATHVAQRLASALSPVRSTGQPVVLYVEKPSPPTEFNEAFHTLLITHLLAQGFGISEDPGAGLPVKYEVQVVTHNLPDLPPPDHEVIVTTSVMTGNRYLTRTSDIYYITEYDIDHYLAQTGPTTRIMEVVGP